MLKLLYFGALLLAAPLKLPDAQAELKAVLTLVLSEKNTAQYLAHYKQDKLAAYCKQLPQYDGKPLKPTGTITCQNGQVVSFATVPAAAKPADPVLVMEAVIIDERQATVRFRIPKEGVTGKYVLHRQAHWAITSAEVYER